MDERWEIDDISVEFGLEILAEIETKEGQRVKQEADEREWLKGGLDNARRFKALVQSSGLTYAEAGELLGLKETLIKSRAAGNTRIRRTEMAELLLLWRGVQSGSWRKGTDISRRRSRDLRIWRGFARTRSHTIRSNYL